MSGTVKSIEVLFIEDSAGDIQLTGQILSELPVPVKLTVARDGLQALTMLSNRLFAPALIILDLSLPLLSGHGVLERNPRKEIPVVVFSASFNDVDVDRAFASGASEYIQKPLELAAYKDAVLKMVEKWIFHGND
jgi:CheY-like chemotaxis protein